MEIFHIEKQALSNFDKLISVTRIADRDCHCNKIRKRSTRLYSRCGRLTQSMCASSFEIVKRWDFPLGLPGWSAQPTKRFYRLGLQ